MLRVAPALAGHHFVRTTRGGGQPTRFKVVQMSNNPSDYQRHLQEAKRDAVEATKKAERDDKNKAERKRVGKSLDDASFAVQSLFHRDFGKWSTETVVSRLTALGSLLVKHKLDGRLKLFIKDHPPDPKRLGRRQCVFVAHLLEACSNASGEKLANKYADVFDTMSNSDENSIKFVEAFDTVWRWIGGPKRVAELRNGSEPSEWTQSPPVELGPHLSTDEDVLARRVEQILKDIPSGDGDDTFQKLENETPTFDRDSGLWVRNKKAAELEGVETGTLRQYRHNGKQNANKTLGRDTGGRVWRRVGNPNSHPWYLRATLQSKNAKP